MQHRYGIRLATFTIAAEGFNISSLDNIPQLVTGLPGQQDNSSGLHIEWRGDIGDSRLDD